MMNAYDYPELFESDEAVRLYISELRKMKRAVKSARQAFNEAAFAISRLQKALKPFVDSQSDDADSSNTA